MMSDHPRSFVLIGVLLALQPACKGKIVPAGGEAPHRPSIEQPREEPRAEDASLPPTTTIPPEEPSVIVPQTGTTKPDEGKPTEPGASGDASVATPPVIDPGAPPIEPTQQPTPSSADGTWSPLSVLTITDPLAFGAKGDGVADDLSALKAAVSALPATGGVVFFPPAKTFKKSDLLIITKSHVKLWSVNRSGEIFQSIAGQQRKQAIIFRGTTGSGVFGLKLRSDGAARYSALEDNQIALDKAQFTELVGNEIQGSAAAGVFAYGSTEHYIEGNYIHHTWADHIHHTNGAKASWVWNNYIFNEPPSKGDDGIACVTYGADSARCNDMEWWHNNIVHTGNGRGYAVIGGNNISIHDNWAVGVAGAGVIIASEAEYSTAASQGITVSRNYVQGCGHTIGHPGILVSGGATSAGPLRDIAFISNVSVGAPNGPYRAEGSFENVTSTGLETDTSALPAGAPTTATIRITDTSSLRTRDTSFVAPEVRKGLYRIQIRRTPSGSGFQQRFEYLIKGTPEIVTTYVNVRLAAADHLVEQRTVAGTAYALLLTAAPISVPSTLSAMTFRELRSNDQDDKLGWLWKRLDATSY